MSGRDELQELWKSQPVQGAVPKFGLMEDLSAPVWSPLSAGNRWLGAAAFLYWVWFFGRQIGSTGSALELAAVWIGLIAAVAAVVLFLSQRESSVDSPAEESIAQFREKLVREFERQSRIQTWIYAAAFVPVIAANLALELGKHAGRSRGVELTFVLLFWGRFFWWAISRVRRANAAAVRRLREREAEGTPG